MLIRRLAPLGLALSLLTNAAFGAGVVMYKRGETPNARDVASILSQSANVPAGLKMRSIRMLPSTPEEKPAESATVEAKLSDVAAETAPSRPTLALASLATSAPTTPAAAKPAADDRPSSLALPVQFAFDSARILPNAYRQLDAVAAGIKLVGPTAKIVIEGHTDAVGSAEYNLRLSSQRADAVRCYLITHHGIDPARLRVVGMGKFAPLNKASPTAPENRRVEFRAEA